MAREVNVFVRNWKKTGKNVSVPQYSVDFTINWSTDDGTPKTRTETLLFPNCLTGIGAEDLKQYMADIMLAEARQRLGV